MRVSMDVARDFTAGNHRAVLITHRRSGGLQTSPVTVGIDGEDRVIISSREPTAKVRNLRRNPAASLCVFTDRWFGAPWIHIDGRAEVTALPEAMEGLVDYYRRISGEHPDWDDYRTAMVKEERVLIRITIDHVGPAAFA
jgi:PPOX class probable F420-dependent enzyme